MSAVDLSSDRRARPAEELPLGTWIFSSDDHLLETTATFAGRVEQRYADIAPQIVDYHGGDAWLIDGELHPIAHSDGVASWPIGERPDLKTRATAASKVVFEANDDDVLDMDHIEHAATTAQERVQLGLVRVAEDFRPGVYDVDARIDDMDRDGVWASVLIPSITFGFAGQRLSLLPNQPAAYAFVRAYNDWLHEDVASRHPERFVCSQIAWLRDPVVGAQEIYRNAERGFRAVLFPENPERFGLPSVHKRHWDPILAACEETETVLNIHLGTGLQGSRVSTDSPLPVIKGSIAVNPSLSAFDWVFSGIPVRYPRIKISFTEGGVDFVPLVYGRLDTLWNDSLDGFWDDELKPAEVLIRNFWFSGLYDVGAYDFLSRVCPDHVMLETDFPHGDSIWPNSQEHFAARLASIRPDHVRKFAIENAAELYRHPVPNCPPSTLGAA